MSSSGLTIKNGPSITQMAIDMTENGLPMWQQASRYGCCECRKVMKQIGGAIARMRQRINRVGAGAAALAYPLNFDPDDKWDFAWATATIRMPILWHSVPSIGE